MDVDELIERAWKAVEKAGVSEAAQPAALQEAATFLREQDGSSGGGKVGGEGSTRRRRSSRATRRSTSRQPAEPPTEDLPDEDTFFATLASESGVDETELRDVLLYTGGKVTVTPPTRMFGDSKTAQAKAITALVAGAHARGLADSTVRAELVHDELKRKGCWDQHNFNKHLRALQGYNVGSNRSEIVTTSKWVGEFSDAVAQGLGKAGDE